MECWILDKEFHSIRIIDSFESFIWADRYNSYGDCEIYTLVDSELITDCKIGNYICNRDSEHLMMITTINIKSDVESGNHLIVKGNSIESILKRRIIWKQTIISGNLQNGIKKLLNENVINPEIEARKIPNFIFKDSSDPLITELTLNAQYTGDNLYDVIKDICQEFRIGWKITLTEDLKFQFELYSGIDRSYAQDKNPYVIFSPSFENINNSNYLESDISFKNVALVAGEGEGVNRRTVTVGSVSGFDRRELFVDARDISSETENGKIPDAQYNASLQSRGNKKLLENSYLQSFEGEVEASQTFIYGIDFSIGDVVQIVNEYGIEAQSRVSEIIRFHDASSEMIIPTFTTV